MIPEGFEEEFLLLYEPDKSKPELSHKLEYLGLYGEFIDRKYGIYNGENSETPTSKLAAIEQPESEFKYV